MASHMKKLANIRVVSIVYLNCAFCVNQRAICGGEYAVKSKVLLHLLLGSVVTTSACSADIEGDCARRIKLIK